MQQLFTLRILEQSNNNRFKDKILYGKTLVSSGTVMQCLKGNLFQNETNLIIVRSMKIDIYGSKQQLNNQIIQDEQNIKLLLTVDLNRLFDKVCILKKNQIYKNDLLLALTQDLDIVVLKFESTGDVFNYRVIYNCSIFDLAYFDPQKQYIINHKLISNIDVFEIDQENRLVAYNLYSNCNVGFNSLLFLNVNIKEQISIQPCKFYLQNSNNQMEDQIEYLQFEKSKNVLSPKLLVQFSNKNLLKQYTLNIDEQQFKQKQYQIQIQQGQYELQNIPQYSIFKLFSNSNSDNMLFIATTKSLYIYQQSQLQLQIDLSKYKQQAISRPISFDIQENIERKKYNNCKQIYDNAILSTVNNISAPLSNTSPKSQNSEEQVDTESYMILNIIYDDSDIINIQIPVQNIQQYKIHKFSVQTCIHIPTPFQIISYKNLIFIGSQTSQSQIFQVDYDNFVIKQSKIQIPLGLGSIQDLSFEKDNKMKIVSGFGRDGQISQARLGLNLKYLMHQEIKIQQKFKDLQYFNLQNMKFKSIIQQNNQTNYITYQNFVFKIDNNELINYCVENDNILDFTIIHGQNMIVTKTYIKYNKNVLNLQINNFKIYGQYLLIQTSKKLLWIDTCKGEGIQIIFELKDFNGQYCLYQNQGSAFLMMIDQQNQLQQFQLKDNKIQQITNVQINNLQQIQQLECLSYCGQLVLLVRCEYKIFYIFIQQDGTILENKLLLSRDSQPYLFNQQCGGDLFIKTKNSLYKIEIFDSQVYALPLLTEKLESLSKYSLLYIQRHYGMQQYQKYNIYSQQQKQYNDEQLYDYILLTYSMISNNEEQKLIINYYDVGKDMNYKTMDKFIKRTCVAVLTDKQTNNNIVLTEQYLGKMQLRLIQKQTLTEIDEIIPYYTICTCLQECYFNNQKYFGLSQFSSRDIFTDILSQNKMDTPSTNSQTKCDIETKIEFYYIKNNKLVIDKTKTVIFNARQPITSFLVLNEIIYAGIGNTLVKQTIEGIVLQELQFNYMVESICNDEEYLYIMASGILYQIDQKSLKIIRKLEQIQDIKLIACQSFIVIVTYCNQLIILDKQFKILSIMNVNQTINCIKMYSDNIYLGCDTGSILHFKFIKQLYLQQFQQLIIDAYIGSQRIINEQNMTNSVDGDILSLYKFLPENSQLTISKQLNISHKELLDLLFKLEYGE